MACKADKMAKDFIYDKDISNIYQIQDNGIYLTMSDAAIMNNDCIKMLDHLVNDNKMKGIYVGINRPSDRIIEELETAGIDTGNIIFIDALTKTVSGNTANSDNRYFMNHINDLTELGILLSVTMKKMKDDQRFFVLIDSITTLLIYNDNNTVLKFLHYLSARFRIMKVNGIFVAFKSAKLEDFFSQVAVFCDDVVELDN
ncbi:hypothetical protein CUJ83_03150 [Methanocella sp. CWC-04]|uniref:KaiC-like domain-containing protein n=1 Tax=Methanooceanicella nereidis TaxID=2052831 RepID=A0AAP2RBH4_9EURY|nr:ATPase domain-containing protein [Methanocella sp. CWC-04]MCD1293992.1 hypothetical protein [Methanocella sp. CWC-04]